MKNMPVKRDEKGNVIVPRGFIFQPEVRDAAGNIKSKEYYRRYGYKKEKGDPTKPDKPKRRYTRRAIAKRDPEPNPAGIPMTKASPAEILIALRKGMAAEIVAMIKEKYEL